MKLSIRTLLATLGICIGTASVVALLSTGEAATAQALKQFNQIGTHRLVVTLLPKSKHDQFREPITTAQLTQLAQGIEGLGQVAIFSSRYQRVYVRNQTIDANVLGTTPNLTSVLTLSLKQGRHLSERDSFNFRCVIGERIAQQLDPGHSQNLLGHQIRFRNRYLTIVGILAHWPENLLIPIDLNRAVLISKPLADRFSTSLHPLYSIWVVHPSGHLASIASQLHARLNTQQPDYRILVRSPERIIQSIQAARHTFTLFLAAIGSIALLVGGIGIMNIMLVSVMERRSEIGLRMAVGACPRDIRQLFLKEAILLTLLGTVAGIVVGEAITFFITFINGWHFSLYFYPWAFAFLLSLLIGMISGVYPAYLAARLDPINTLRTKI